MKLNDLIQSKIDEVKAKLDPLDAEMAECAKTKVELAEKLEKAKKSISFKDKQTIPTLESEILELDRHIERTRNQRNNLQLGTNDLVDIYPAVEAAIAVIRDENKHRIEAAHKIATELVKKLNEINDIESKERANVFGELDKLADYVWDNALSGLKQGKRMSFLTRRIVDPLSGADDYGVTAIIREALRYT